MKSFIFVLLFSVLSIAASAKGMQVKKPDAPSSSTETQAKSDTASKKPAKSNTSKQQDSNNSSNSNQKQKKENAEESPDYFGPLSWKPGLLY